MVDHLKRCQLSSPVSVINIWWSAAMLFTSTFEICIQQLSRVEEMVWLPYDAGLSAAAETLVGILKRVIVTPAGYPRFLRISSRRHSEHWVHTVTTLVTTAEWCHVWNRVHTTAQWTFRMSAQNTAVARTLCISWALVIVYDGSTY